MSTPNREKEIFNQAGEIPLPEARAEYVHDACQGDRALELRIHALLRASQAPAGFLPGESNQLMPAEGAPDLTGLGAVVGRYKLLEQIGEGGFGVVYMAAQLEPIQRRVALKIIKPGMDSKQVIGRFEAERQALALMDHPNIAQIFEAGATASGRPYFAMELVRGMPITKFCEEQQFDTQARLLLFI